MKCGEVESECHTEYAGIREGRPVSPYLFTLVIGELFADTNGVMHKKANGTH